MCLHYTLHGDYNAYLAHSIVIVCSNTDSKHQSLIATSLWWMESNMNKDTDSMATDDKGEDNPAFVAEDSEEAQDISKISKNYNRWRKGWKKSQKDSSGPTQLNFSFPALPCR